MRKLFILSVTILFLALFLAVDAVKAADAAAGCGPAVPTKNWRVGGMYSLWTNDRTTDFLGNGWGVEVERSFGRIWVGDLSGVANYRRFSRDAGGFDNRLDYYAFGAKYRLGQGASPSRDGFYYGIGVAFAFLNETIQGVGDISEGVEGSALLGINFARSWFGEFSYRSPSDAREIDSNNMVFELGYRF